MVIVFVNGLKRPANNVHIVGVHSDQISWLMLDFWQIFRKQFKTSNKLATQQVVVGKRYVKSIKLHYLTIVIHVRSLYVAIVLCLVMLTNLISLRGSKMFTIDT